MVDKSEGFLWSEENGEEEDETGAISDYLQENGLLMFYYNDDKEIFLRKDLDRNGLLHLIRLLAEMHGPPISVYKQNDTDIELMD